MQLKLYLSATFADLEQHREKVYRELRSLRRWSALIPLAD